MAAAAAPYLEIRFKDGSSASIGGEWNVRELTEDLPGFLLIPGDIYNPREYVSLDLIARLTIHPRRYDMDAVHCD